MPYEKKDGTTSHDEGQKKRGCKTTIMDWLKRSNKLPEFKFMSFELDGVTRSEGLIFKAQLQISNPFSFDIPKWKLANYSVRSHGRFMCGGNIPSRALKAKETTQMEVIIKVPLTNLNQWWAEIQHTISDGKIQFQLELDVTLSLGIFKERKLPRITYHKEMKVSEAIDGLAKEILTADSFAIVHLATELALKEKTITHVLKELLTTLSHKHTDSLLLKRLIEFLD